MIYLTKDDLITDAFERLIDESSNDHTGILDEQEARVVAMVKSILSSKYDVAKIFDAVNPIRNEVLISIISRIVIYKIIRRNAARKVPTDYKEDYDEAVKDLEKIATGRIVLNDLPSPTEDDQSVSTSMWGNNSNKDFYI